MPGTVAPVPRTLPGVLKMSLLGSLGLEIARVGVLPSELSLVTTLEGIEGDEAVEICVIGFRRGRRLGRVLRVDALEFLQWQRHQVTASRTTTRRQTRSTMTPIGVFDATPVERRDMASGAAPRLACVVP